MLEQNTLKPGHSERPPQCVVERYRPDEQAQHTLVQSDGDMQMWRSQVDRTSRDLPPHVRFHILNGGEVEALLMPERIAEQNWGILTS